MFPRPLLVVDTETTGFQSHPWARVVEIGVTLIDEYNVEIDRFESLICPDVLDERANDALRVNNISIDDLRRAPPAEVVAQRLHRWLTNCGAEYVLATAYNRAFDEPMCARSNLPIPGWTYCAMESGRAEFGRVVKLAEAARRLGVLQMQPAHRALGDARTAANIVIELDKRALARGLGCIAAGGGAYPALSMAFPCSVPLSDWPWPSAAHALAAVASPNPAQDWPAILGMDARALWEHNHRATPRVDWLQVRAAWLAEIQRVKFQDPGLSLALRSTGKVRMTEAAGEPEGLGTALEGVRAELSDKITAQVGALRIPY